MECGRRKFPGDRCKEYLKSLGPEGDPSAAPWRRRCNSLLIFSIVLETSLDFIILIRRKDLMLACFGSSSSMFDCVFRALGLACTLSRPTLI